MSTTIEEKVVEMRFNNKNFEKNVQGTMSTLDKLKQKLNLTGASKGLENIDTTAKSMNFSGLSNAVETVSAKFSALQVMGITALANITNSAVNAGKRIVSALTIDPIKTGFNEYETQINAVQTILANTSNKGTTLNDVNSALDTLNTYADKTIYNFTEMTRNIGTFTAAGVDLDTSVKSIQGIANLAAVSGSTSQQASTAMYQLSQALAAGKVQLMDWNSVVNAGMGGQVFQDALKRTAKNMGKDVDGMIAKYGSFRESLSKGEWLTSDVLTKTLEQFTMAAEEGSEAWNNYKKSLMAEGYTEAQATEILKMANTATDAATKVKTFTQLWDTLKESAQSGWTQTWEILVGDFEEAKGLLTGISTVVGNFINKTSEARNNLLQGWKDAGGRTATIDALKNAFEGIINIVSPIKEAFSDIFPPLTVKQLMSFSNKLKELTGNFAEFTEKHGPQIKSTFKGIFAVVDIVATVFGKIAGGILKVAGSLLGFTGGILSGTATLGDFLSNIRDSIKESNIFGKVIDKIVGFLQNGINKVKEFGSSLKESFKSDGYNGFVGFLKAVWEFITQIGSGISKAFGGLGKAIANLFGENSFGDVVDSGLFAGLLVGLYKLVDILKNPLESVSEIFGGFKDATENIVGILDDVRGCFQAYQEQLKAGTLLKIASAIGILAASIFVISTIDPESLGSSLGAITMLFVELSATMFALSKITPGLKSVLAMIPLMLSMSTSMLILAAALKVIGSLKPEQMVTGLVGVAGGLIILVKALKRMPENDVIKASKAIRKLSSSLLVLSVALKIMGSMKWHEMAVALGGVVIGLTAMVVAVNKLPENKTMSLIGMATALVILGGALKLIGSMKWTELALGLGSVIIGLTAMVVAARKLPVDKTMSLMGMAAALVVFGSALKLISSMDWTELALGLGTVVIGLTAMVVAARNLPENKTMGLIGMSTALVILGGALKIIGSMNIISIAKALGTLVGVFVIFGIAGKLLTPVIPAILGLAGACALFGLSAVAIGAGLTLIATGLTLLATSVAVGATAIVAGITVIITGLLDLIPTIASKLGEAIKTFAKVIGDCAPDIADSILKLISELLKSLATYTPIIANSIFDLLIGVLDVLAARMPELINSAVKLINNFFVGVANALKNLDGANLLKGVIAVGLMTGLAYALAGISSIVGPAMVGLLGVGALIAELALVLAAVGALSQIPGLSWLIGEGGNLLSKIGTAIGQFVGGIVGGIAQGFTDSLPKIAINLSDFMTSIKPFVDGAKNIDKSVLTGITNLVEAVLAITGANIITSITSFLTGKDSLSKFGEQLIPFGKSMLEYSKVVAGIDANSIMLSAIAAKALAKVAEAIPKSGGLFNLFTGSDSLLSFAIQLVPFGKSLKAYAQTVAGIDTQAIIGSASAAKALAKMTECIPNTGGMIAWFTGDNSVAKFGKDLVLLGLGLKNFAIATTGIVPENIIGVSTAAKALAEMMTIIPNEGGIVAWLTGDNSVSKFGNDLVSLGLGLKNFAIITTGIIPESIIATANAAKALADMVSVIPNQGGMVAWFTGDNSVSKFAMELPTLGMGLKMFSDATTGINAESITAAANAAKALAQMTATIPNQGGMVAWFTGENSVANFAADLPELGKGIKAFSDSVVGINAENIIAASNAAKALAQMVNIIPKEGGIKAWFTGETSISKFASKLPELGKGIKGFSDSVAGIVPENVTAAANAAKALAQMADTTPKNTDKIVTFGENLVKFGGKLKSYFEKTAGITPESITASSNAIKSVNEATKGLDGSKISSASKALDKLTKTLKNMSNVSESSVSGFTKAMKKLGKVNVQGILDAFDKAGSKLEKAGKEAINKLADGVKKQESKMKDAGSSAVKKLADGIKSQNSTIKSACKKVVADCATAIKSYRSSFYDAGSYLVSGFASGISANSYKATAKAVAMASAAEKAARDELKINSPSKVFRKIGSGVPKGFAQGITMFSSSIKDSVGNMSDTAISGIQGIMTSILDAINMDVDSQPTIRPVLDLTDIQSGAGTINGILNNVGIGANLGAISYGMNTRSQNGTNNDVVSAINKLSKNLGNIGGDTYNVNGITYDDGSNITEAVRTLVRAAKIERRV